MPKIIDSFINKIVNDENSPLLQESNTNKECIICLDEMTDETSKKLNCGHSFHSDCINSWNSIQITCPICRAVSSSTFVGYIIPTIWCVFFKRKVTLVCSKKTIDITVNYFFKKKEIHIPYKKIHSISASTNYLILHLKNKNIMLKLKDMNISALYNLLYSTLHNNTTDIPPF